MAVDCGAVVVVVVVVGIAVVVVGSVVVVVVVVVGIVVVVVVVDVVVVVVVSGVVGRSAVSSVVHCRKSRFGVMLVWGLMKSRNLAFESATVPKSLASPSAKSWRMRNPSRS